MKLHYEVTVEDLVAFAFYQSGRSPGRRRQRAGAAIWWTLAATAFSLVVTVSFGTAAVVALALVLLPFLFVLGMLWKLGFRPNTDYWIRRTYEERLPRGAAGPHELELTEDYLVVRTPYSEQRTPLEDVQGATSDGERTFIYTGPWSALVIPHRALSERDLEAFVEAVRMRLSEKSSEPIDRPGD